MDVQGIHLFALTTQTAQSQILSAGTMAEPLIAIWASSWLSQARTSMIMFSIHGTKCQIFDSTPYLVCIQTFAIPSTVLSRTFSRPFQWRESSVYSSRLVNSSRRAAQSSFANSGSTWLIFGCMCVLSNR